jgi:DNA polymerase-3 subunit delta'
MNLDEIVGNRQLIEYLKKSALENKLSHSYIFEGISGIGKMLVAENFSKMILCDSKIDKPCGICKSCIKFDSLNHPDFKIISPDGRSIKNKQIEEFQEYISTKPYYGNYKIVIIDEGETMTISAQNRILKTIEDSPKYLIVIFICKSAKGMLQTIESRCQTLSFNRIEKKEIIQYLNNNHGISKEEGAIFASFSDGSMKKALDVAISKNFNDFRKFSFDLIKNIETKNKVKLYNLLDELSEFKDYSIEELLDLILIFYRDLLFILEFDLKDSIINKDYEKELGSLCRHVDRKNIVKYIELIGDTKNMLNENVNELLALESFFINIWEV